VISAKIESAPAPHQRGVPAGTGRGAVRWCIGHIRAAEWSQVQSSPATTAMPGRAVVSMMVLAVTARLK